MNAQDSEVTFSPTRTSCFSTELLLSARLLRRVSLPLVRATLPPGARSHPHSPRRPPVPPLPAAPPPAATPHPMQVDPRGSSRAVRGSPCAHALPRPDTSEGGERGRSPSETGGRAPSREKEPRREGAPAQNCGMREVVQAPTATAESAPRASEGVRQSRTQNPGKHAPLETEVWGVSFKPDQLLRGYGAEKSE